MRDADDENANAEHTMTIETMTTEEGTELTLDQVYNESDKSVWHIWAKPANSKYWDVTAPFNTIDEARSWMQWAYR